MKHYGVGLLLALSLSLHGMDWIVTLENLYYFPCSEKFNMIVKENAIPDSSEYCPILQERDAWRDSLLVYAIRAQNESLVMDILRRRDGKVLLNAQNCSGNTPLHEAIIQMCTSTPLASERLSNIIVGMLNDEQLLPIPNNEEYDPLEFACINKQWKIGQLILQSPLYKMRHEDKELWKKLVNLEEYLHARILLKKMPDFVISNDYKINLNILEWIIKYGSSFHLRYFLEKVGEGYFSHGFESREVHPLNIAVSMGAYDKAEILLEKGVFLRDAQDNLSVESPSQFNCLHVYKLLFNQQYKKFWKTAASLTSKKKND